MLVQVFPKLKNFLPVKILRGYFASPLHVVVIGFLMTLGELLAIELAVFWCDIILAALSLFLSDDTLAAVPVACCGYMTIAAKNNNIMAAREGRETIFRDPAFQIQLFFIIALGVLLLLARLVTLLIENPHRAGMPRLLPGFLALGLAYLLGGGASSHYSSRTVLFGFVQIASLAFFYLYFHYTLDFKKIRKDYAPILFFVIGLFISVQILGMYQGKGVFLSDGSVSRGALYTGWGTYNNVGGIMAMCIPAPFYFMMTKKRGHLFMFPAIYFLFATFLTQSRGSILFGTVVFVVCLIWTLIKTRGRVQQGVFLFTIALLVLLFAAFIALRRELDALFASIKEAGTDDSNRFNIWKNCWAAFKGHPIFGVGFYDTPGFGFEYNVDHGAFIPPRAHNTLFQLLATGGVVLAAAYAFHRIQTLVLLLKKPSPEKNFAFFVVLALVLTSLLDCHFFNIGPGILYGVVLCFAEEAERMKSGEIRPKLRTCPARNA